MKSYVISSIATYSTSIYLTGTVIRTGPVGVREFLGQADAQKLISKTLTPLLLKHRSIEAVEKIGTSSNSKVHIIMGNGEGDFQPVILGGVSDKE